MSVLRAGPSLEEVGGLGGLFWTDPTRVAANLGLNPATVQPLWAAVELSRRLGSSECRSEIQLIRPETVAHYAQTHLLWDRPGIIALYVDMENHPIFHLKIVSESFSGQELDPSAVLRPAIEQSAAGLILIRPAGSGEVEVEMDSGDLAQVRKVMDSAKLLGIRFLDYLILGARGSWLSLNQLGHW